jgi:hypothetical protein
VVQLKTGGSALYHLNILKPLWMNMIEDLRFNGEPIPEEALLCPEQPHVLFERRSNLLFKPNYLWRDKKPKRSVQPLQPPSLKVKLEREADKQEESKLNRKRYAPVVKPKPKKKISVAAPPAFAPVSAPQFREVPKVKEAPASFGESMGPADRKALKALQEMFPQHTEELIGRVLEVCDFAVPFCCEVLAQCRPGSLSITVKVCASCRTVGLHTTDNCRGNLVAKDTMVKVKKEPKSVGTFAPIAGPELMPFDPDARGGE